MILYLSQVYNVVVRQSYTLQSAPPGISSTPLAPYLVITILLTVKYYAVLHSPISVL